MFKSFQELIIIILQKNRKINYLLLSSYYLIALKNTIIKLLKKLIAEWIAETIKIYNFFFMKSDKNQKKRSILIALKLLTFCVNTAWKIKSKCIVLMFSLDLNEVFNNVLHKRLLYIM